MAKHTLAHFPVVPEAPEFHPPTPSSDCDPPEPDCNLRLRNRQRISSLFNFVLFTQTNLQDSYHHLAILDLTSYRRTCSLQYNYSDCLSLYLFLVVSSNWDADQHPEVVTDTGPAKEQGGTALPTQRNRKRLPFTNLPHLHIYLPFRITCFSHGQLSLLLNHRDALHSPTSLNKSTTPRRRPLAH